MNKDEMNQFEVCFIIEHSGQWTLIGRYIVEASGFEDAKAQAIAIYCDNNNCETVPANVCRIEEWL